MFLYDENSVRRIRERSAAMEKIGEPEPWLLELAYAAKLFKLFVPEEYGGAAAGLPEALRLFSGREAVLAGSGMPTGKARPVPGGYRVSGTWRFCSGSTFASFFTANCEVEAEAEAEGGSPIRSFAFMPEQVRIVRDWEPLGLRATASHSIAVEDVFVPETMTFDITSEPRFGHPIYRVPFLAFAQTSFAAAAIGIGRHYLEEAGRFAKEKAPAWRESQPGRLAALEAELAQRRDQLEAAAEGFYAETERAWERFAREGGRVADPDGLWREAGRLSQEAAAVARSGAQAVFPYLGMTALLAEHPLSRTWRDLHTIAQHAVLLPVD
jgi:alkylation response protein AidB-like acyl-CoA dehydrogenase